MAIYKIRIKKSAQKEITALQLSDRKKIVFRIQKLAKEPRSVDCKKLSAQERYRIRVGNFRILYEIQDVVLIVTVVRVAHRKDFYR